jgi:hypothetical protein
MTRSLCMLLIHLLFLVSVAHAESESKIFLVCHADTKFQGVIDAPFEIDLINSTVNGFKADIVSNKIVWKSGDTTFTINRLNGFFISINEVNNMVVTGNCEKAKDKLF